MVSFVAYGQYSKLVEELPFSNCTPVTDTWSFAPAVPEGVYQNARPKQLGLVDQFVMAGKVVVNVAAVHDVDGENDVLCVVVIAIAPR